VTEPEAGRPGDRGFTSSRDRFFFPTTIGAHTRPTPIGAHTRPTQWVTRTQPVRESDSVVRLQHSIISRLRARGAVPPLPRAFSRRGATGTHECITQSTLHAISHLVHAEDNAGTSSACCLNISLRAPGRCINLSAGQLDRQWNYAKSTDYVLSMVCTLSVGYTTDVTTQTPCEGRNSSLIKKFNAFYGPRRFTVVPTITTERGLFYARRIQSTFTKPISLSSLVTMRIRNRSLVQCIGTG
jgi:hypothetical protein